MKPTVVKVGGSFARYSRLGDVVAALAKGGGRTVIVPGGGPFADAVRREQVRIGFDDRVAHRMALLAMASFGMMLAGMSDALKPAADMKAIRAALRTGSVAIWLPLDILAGDDDIPESWEMTSDSLAIWLAGRLSARLVFLKRKTPPLGSAANLVAAGVLDPLAPRFLARTGVDAWISGPRDLEHLGPALAAGTGVGRRIEVA